MAVDESRRDNHPGRIDGARGVNLYFARVTDKDDAVAANADIGFACTFPRAIDELAVNDEDIERGRSFSLQRRALVKAERENDQTKNDECANRLAKCGRNH